MDKILYRLLAGIVLLFSGEALAQSNPGLRTGQVPTAAQWNSYLSAKLDYLGFTPLNPSNLIGRGPINVISSSGIVSINCPTCGMLATYGGTGNALVLTVAPAPTSLSTGDRFTFQVGSTNNAATTARINSLPIYNVYKAGPSGASPLNEHELVPGMTVNLSFDSTLNSGAGGWWLDGRASGTLVPANCAVLVPFNSNLQSGFTIAEGGASGGSNISPFSAGYQSPCMTGNLEFHLDNFHITSTDPSGTTTFVNTPGDWNIVSPGTASNGAGGTRLTLTSTTGLVSGNKYGVSSVYGSVFVNGYWTITVVDGTHIDIPVAYDPGRPWVTSPNFLPGFVSTGELDTQPYYSCNRIVLGRTPGFNDAICMHVATSQTIQSPNAAQGYGANNWWIVDPDQTVTTHSQSLYTIANFSNIVGGGRRPWPSFGVMRGVMTFAPDPALTDDRTCGGIINAHSQAGLIQCDKGFGTISANIAFFSYNQPIGQPPGDMSNGLRVTNNTGTPLTKIDISFKSVSLQGPHTAVGGNPNSYPQSTTIVNTSTASSLLYTIDVFATGINGSRTGSIAANTTYYVYVLKNYLTGTSGGFLTDSNDPANFPTATSGGYTSGYYALIGQVKTKLGAAEFDTFVIENGIAQYTASASATMTSAYCSPQNYRTQILAGGAGNNTLTFGAATGFLSDCQMQIINTDAANTKTLAFGGTPANFVVAAGQAAIVQRVGAVFQVLPYALPPSAGCTFSLTGDVTSTSGSCATALVNIPTGTTMAGNLLATNIAAPAAPSAGTTRIYVGTDGRLHDRNSADIGTTVVFDTGTANNYISAISASGVITKSRPTCATLSDSAAFCSSTDAAGLSGTVASARISGSYTGITGVGALTAGTWTATPIGPTYGGTGVNNGSSTITLSGNVSLANTLTTAGNFAMTITATATTNSTLPAGTHTLAGLDVAQTWTAVQTYSLNSGALQAAQTGTVVRLANANGTATRLELDAYGSQAFFTTLCAGGTAAVPTTITSGTQCGGYNMFAYDGTAFAGPAATFRTFANETWAVGAHGSYAEVAVTASLGTTLVTSIRFEADGGITVPPTVSGGNKGVGTINATGLYVAGVAVTGAGITVLTGDVTGTGPGSTSTTIASNAVTTAKINNNAVTLAKLATQPADTILANVTSGTAVPTAATTPTTGTNGCAGSANALIYTSGAGFGCNLAINAAALGGATFASPGAIGTSTAANGTFLALTGTSGSITGLTAFSLRDTSAAFNVTIASTSSTTLTAGRTLTLDMGNVAHTLAFGTNAGSVYTFPSAPSGTIPLLNLAQTFSAAQTFTGQVTMGSAGVVCQWLNGGTNSLNCSGGGLAIYSATGGIALRVAGADPVATYSSTDLTLMVPLFVRASASSTVANFQQSSGSTGSLNIVADVGNAYVSMFKDPTPTFAWSFGLSAAGISISNDIIWAAYNGSAWTERVRFSQAGGLSVGTTTDPGAGAILSTGAIKTTATTASVSKATGAIISGGGLGVNGALFTDTINVITMAADTATVDTTVCRVAASGLLLTGTGTLGICLGTPSVREAKQQIIDVEDGIDQITKLRPKNFFYKPGYGDNGTREQYGFIADEFSDVLPKLTHTDERGNPLTIDLLGTIPILVKAIQQLKADNDNLRALIMSRRAANQ